MCSDLGEIFEIIGEIWVMFPNSPEPFDIFTDGEHKGLAYRYPDNTHAIVLDCLYDDIQYVEQESAHLIAVKSSGKWGSFKLNVSHLYPGIFIDVKQTMQIIYDDICFTEHITAS